MPDIPPPNSQSVRLTDGQSFYNATRPTDTQPVSLPAELIDAVNNALRVNTVAGGGGGGGDGTVEVTNFPAIQPVSGTLGISSLPSLPAGTNNIGDVDILSLPSLPAGTNNIGDVDILSLPSLPAGSNQIGRVQRNIDVARTPVFLEINNIAGQTSENLVSYGGWVGGVALSAGTGAYRVTAGKVFRLQALQVVASGTALATARVKLRAAATVANNSPVYAGMAVVTPANGGGGGSAAVPEGQEIAGGLQVGITFIGVTTQTWSAYVVGYEY